MFVIFFGFIVGFLTSIFGIGGGIVVVPFLPEVVDITHKEAVGTSLLMIVIVSGINTFFYWKKGLVEKKILLKMGLFAGLGGILGSLLLTTLSNRVSQSLFLFLVVSFFCREFYFFLKNKTGFTFQWPKILKTIFQPEVVYASIGLICGLTGIGGGILWALILINNASVAKEKVAPTSNAIMCIGNFIALWGYLAEGTFTGTRWGLIHGDLAFTLVLGAVFTAFLGRKFQHKIPAVAKKITYLTLLTLVFFRLVMMMY